MKLKLFLFVTETHKEWNIRFCFVVGAQQCIHINRNEMRIHAFIPACLYADERKKETILNLKMKCENEVTEIRLNLCTYIRNEYKTKCITLYWISYFNLFYYFFPFSVLYFKRQKKNLEILHFNIRFITAGTKNEINSRQKQTKIDLIGFSGNAMKFNTMLLFFYHRHFFFWIV